MVCYWRGSGLRRLIACSRTVKGRSWTPQAATTSGILLFLGNWNAATAIAFWLGSRNMQTLILQRHLEPEVAEADMHWVHHGAGFERR